MYCYAERSDHVVGREKMIRSNKIKCLNCLDIIESKSVHDLKWCKCKSVAVDGGREYLRRVCARGNYKDLTEYEAEDM